MHKIVIFLFLLFASLYASGQTTYTVTNNGDTGPGSLREAVSMAQNGDIVTFDDNYTIVLSTEIAVSRSITMASTINDCFFQNNKVVKSGAGATGSIAGGALFTTVIGGLTINNSVFDSNTSAGQDNFDLPFITQNVERMRITTGGRVGIGTTTPRARFSVSGGPISLDDFTPGDKLNMLGYSDAAKISLGVDATFGMYAGSLVKADGLAPDNANNGLFSWSVADASNTWREVMRLVNNGNLGVGTNNPGAKLDVNGTTLFEGQVTIATITVSTKNSCGDGAIATFNIINGVFSFTGGAAKGVNYTPSTIDVGVKFGLTAPIVPCPPANANELNMDVQYNHSSKVISITNNGTSTLTYTVMDVQY